MWTTSTWIFTIQFNRSELETIEVLSVSHLVSTSCVSLIFCLSQRLKSPIDSTLWTQISFTNFGKNEESSWHAWEKSGSRNKTSSRSKLTTCMRCISLNNKSPCLTTKKPICTVTSLGLLWQLYESSGRSKTVSFFRLGPWSWTQRWKTIALRHEGDYDIM